MGAGGAKGPSETEKRLLEEEKARQAELRRQAELARMSRGRRLAMAPSGDMAEDTILGGPMVLGSGSRIRPGP